MTKQEIRMKEWHESLQKDLPENRIRLREGLIINTSEKSRYGFEFFCWRSPEAIDEMNAFLFYAKGKHCFLDVGAAYGIYSHVFCEINKNGFAHAIEPSVYAVREINRLNAGRVYAHEMAFSDHDYDMKMTQEWAHLVSDENCQDLDKFQYIPCTTGDWFCDDKDFHPDLIKIDIEGMEVKALRGLERVIMRERPTICLEVHPKRMDNLGNTLIELADFILGIGYSIRDTHGDSVLTHEDILNFDNSEHRLILLPE